jgi:hypothetical protein
LTKIKKNEKNEKNILTAQKACVPVL